MTTNLLEIAQYRHIMFGHAGTAWRSDSWSMRTLAEQIKRGEVSPYTMTRLTEEIPATVIARCIATPTPPTQRRCDGYGNVHLGHDSDYDCGGCVGCRPQAALIGWSIGAFVWSIATGAERARLELGVRGMAALASIGAAIEAALEPGRGVSRWIGDTVAEWNGVRVGRWYRVAGRRGKAKDHHGAQGEVMKIEEAPGRFGSRGTLRAALKITGEEKWAWVPASALEPAFEPEHIERDKRAAAANKAERAARPAFVGNKGDAVYVIDGPNAGRNGAVFWQGFSRGEQRVGVRWGAGETDVAWCSACDVIGAHELATVTAEITGGMTAAEAALALGDEVSRGVLGDSLEERGLPGLAAAWRGLIPQNAVQRPVRARPARIGGRRSTATY